MRHGYRPQVLACAAREPALLRASDFANASAIGIVPR